MRYIPPAMYGPTIFYENYVDIINIAIYRITTETPVLLNERWLS